ncbi:MAG: hypothetical protein PHS97_01980 [Oscillospiraceae bacterium]|nr:hypothetical protein [Oscillospiraceae bacterium]
MKRMLPLLLCVVLMGCAAPVAQPVSTDTAPAATQALPTATPEPTEKPWKMDLLANFDMDSSDTLWQIESYLHEQGITLSDGEGCYCPLSCGAVVFYRRGEFVLFDDARTARAVITSADYPDTIGDYRLNGSLRLVSDTNFSGHIRRVLPGEFENDAVPIGKVAAVDLSAPIRYATLHYDTTQGNRLDISAYGPQYTLTSPGEAHEANGQAYELVKDTAGEKNVTLRVKKGEWTYEISLSAVEKGQVFLTQQEMTPEIAEHLLGMISWETFRWE